MVSPHTLFVSTDWGMLRAIFSFFAGCLVYELRVRSAAVGGTKSVEACSVVLVHTFVLTTPSGGSQYAFPMLATIVIYVFSFDQGEFRKSCGRLRCKSSGCGLTRST